MKQQQHDINLRRNRRKKSESQMGFEPKTLRDLVECSNQLSYWRLYGEQGPRAIPSGTRIFFFRFLLKLTSCCCCFIFNILTLEVGWSHLGYALRWQHDAVSEFVTSCVPVITWLCSCVMRFQSRPTNWPLLTIESPVAQLVRAFD